MNKVHVLIWLLCLLLMGHISVRSQEVSARVHFKSDSLWIGRPCTLRLYIRIPSGMEVVIKDDMNAFGSFEKISYTDYPLQDKGSYSMMLRDYTLRSFEVIPRQSVALEIGGIQRNDTVYQTIRSDSITLVEKVDSLTLVEGTYRKEIAILELKDPPNIRDLIIMGLGGVFVLVIVYFLFRRPLTIIWKRYRLKKSQELLHRQWRAILGEIEQKETFILKLDQFWKSYFSNIYMNDLHALTTSEVANTLKKYEDLTSKEGADLLNVSKCKDAIVHGGLNMEQKLLHDYARKVWNVMEEEFQRQRINIA